MRKMNTKQIEQSAADWVAREDHGLLDAAEARRRDAWLAEDVRHLGAYARAHAVFTRLDRAGALGSGYDPRRFATVAPRRARSSRRWLWWPGVAATLACVWLGLHALPEAESPRHATRIGEVLRLPLQDGSAVTLNSDSELRVHFDGTRRRIELLRGEALFDVAKDPRRPFEVEAGAGRVVAVGTSFTVQRGADQSLQVLVREGVVEVADVQPQAVRLTANHRASARRGLGVAVTPVPADELGRRLAWRDGMISFDGDTLAQAAAEFARYSQTRILIDDPSVAARRVVGLYSATDPAGFAHAVADSMGLRAEPAPGGIYLRRHGDSVSDGGNAAATHPRF